MASAKNNEAPSQAKETWSVAVICEDELTRSRALAACDRLVQQFWAEIEFQFHWWQFAHLREAAPAHDAANVTAAADMIVWATHPEGDFPEHVTAWIQMWLGKRGNREGALVALVGHEHDLLSKGMAKHLCLRDVAHRAHMDFLSEIPKFIRRGIPESLQWFNERAGQGSSTLDDILGHPGPPPGTFE